MKKYISGMIPAAMILLFAIIYGFSLPHRPLIAPDEYDFAALLMRFFPETSGCVLPKLPALAATLICAVLIWITARSLRLLHPWMPVVIYLLLPPVWFYGTASLPVQIFALAVSGTAAMLFFARKTTHSLVKGIFCLLAVFPAVLAAILLKYHQFSLAGAVMSAVPFLALSLGAYLERADDRGKGAKYVDRFIRLLVLLSLTALAMLILPPMCRYFQWEYPARLVIFPPGTSIMRPALVCIVPLLWYFMAKRETKISGKMLFIAAGAGFILLTLPPILPWQKFLHNTPGKTFSQLAGELKRENVKYFADSNSAGVLAYEWRVPVTSFGRRPGEMRPLELRDAVKKALVSGDAVVVLSNREFDSYLPPESRGTIYTSGSKRRIIHYFGGKK